MVLQAYDFLELARRHGCVLQMGGSDQWGNIVNGVELGRRIDNRALFGLTTPLITTASGAKMGKTAQGAVWLTDDRLQRLRLLAVLAQHRGRRRRPLPAPLHRSAAGRDRAAGAAAGQRDQRGEEGARHRGDRALPRPRGRRGGGRDRAAGLRRGRHRQRAADRRACRAASSSAACPSSSCFSARGLAASNGEARRLVRGGGAPRQRCGGQGRDPAGHRRGYQRRRRRSSSRPAASATRW